jgi:hypothetical protein
VDGSEKMPNDLMESIEPFNLADAVPFETEYLSGFLAEKYDVEANTCFARANERLRQSTENALRQTVTGYTSVSAQACNVELRGSNVQYALLPVWMLNTAWNGQRYTFAVNGQSGKAIGNMPMDKGAFVRWWLILAAILGAVAFAVALLLTYL